MKRGLLAGLLVVGLLFAGPILVVASGQVSLNTDWAGADRARTGIAPDPISTPEALVQVYAARAFSWRGIFGVHTWIATKQEDTREFTVRQVIGWRQWSGRSVVSEHTGFPDHAWYGNRPQVIAELRGARAAGAIAAIEAASARYPYGDRYSVWPGPNSNTFTAFVARRVPALNLHLPSTAIGKDYLAGGSVFGRAPSGTGYQLSLFGLLGVLFAWQEGIEVNILGLSFGIDPLGLAVNLPGIGRAGLLSRAFERDG